MTSKCALENFWPRLLEGDVNGIAALLEADAAWDDPLFDGAHGDAVKREAIPRLAKWASERSVEKKAQPFCTTADSKRVVVESVIRLKNGMIWNQEASRAEKAPMYDLAVAVVGDRATSPDKVSSVRIYFSTWAALEGHSRLRVGPICPDERAATKKAMDEMPTVRKYFDRLATGDASIIDLFEPDGYFREPANNFACGRDQLGAHFRQILTLGGVGIEFLTSTRQGDRLGIELQTVKWGSKQMREPQAGFACYELGPYGLLRGSRVYDSVVPPSFD